MAYNLYYYPIKIIIKQQPKVAIGIYGKCRRYVHGYPMVNLVDKQAGF
jgi:hypothetical protein